MRTFPEPARVSPRKVVVVTGGTAGVGRATVRAFASKGASVAILARDPDRLQVTVEEVAARGGQALALGADVANAAAVDDAA
jgi:NADP-dependent 3-hydroxy acid dehydrogenase YdfG